ncbi:MAG: hypothetical protein ACFFHD_05735 [Promethearchaeota archaeon]
MTEEKKKRLRGFAGVVSKLVDQLNNNEKFKEGFKDTEIRILLNATDANNAALIVIDKGKIYVESINNKPKKNLKKKNADWDTRISAKMQDFVDLLTSENLSIRKVLSKILTFKLRIRKIRKAVTILKLFEY